MIAALVQFTLRDPISLEKAHAKFSEAQDRYREVTGLITKYFTVAEDGGAIGGVYLWRSKADAEAFYNEPWRASIVSKYGSPPTITYLQVPVVVHNFPTAAPAAGA